MTNLAPGLKNSVAGIAGPSWRGGNSLGLFFQKAVGLIWSRFVFRAVSPSCWCIGFIATDWGRNWTEPGGSVGLNFQESVGLNFREVGTDCGRIVKPGSHAPSKARLLPEWMGGPFKPEPDGFRLTRELP